MIGLTKLLSALPNFGIDKHNPNAKLNYPPSNHLDIIAAYAAFKLSDPIPKIHLPANIVP